MIELLRSLVGGERAGEVIYECRNCGTILDADEEKCPQCDSTDVAHYEIE